MIEGQVAAIINERELAINRGSQHGVARGMKFEVLEPGGVAITDPETKTELGSVTIVKIRVRVTAVERKWAIAETFEFVGGGAGGGLFTAAAMLGYGSAHVRTLRTDEAIARPLSEAESYVKRGDPVREIQEASAVVGAKQVSAPPKTPDV